MSESIRVCAASSLRHELHEKIQFHEEIEPDINTLFDASSRIARQVEKGAKCHVFVSASSTWVDRLEESGAIQRRWTAPDWRNSLAVLKSSELSVRLASLEDLEHINRLAIGGPNVPLGAYSREVLTRFPNQRAQVIVGRNAEHVLRLVERGEVDAAIVYASDIPFARDSKLAFHISEALHSPVQYELALLREAPPEASLLFDRLREHGIGPLSSSQRRPSEGLSP